jgi:pyrophosphatase PpaX
MPTGSYEWNQVDTIYFDLDGTLLDVSMRYYRLHCDLCQYLNEEALPFQLFWQLKREKGTTEQILPKGSPEIRERYASEWLTLIEDPNYLHHDALLPGVSEVLGELRKKFNLVLVTMRRNRPLLDNELAHHGISDLFVQVISASHSNDKHRKWQLIREESIFLQTQSLIVGDNEEDIEAGKRLGFGTIAVINGIRTRIFLEQLNPDILIRDIRELPSLLFR